ncbi:hypothetical protein JCGZ_19508 [Jatropha curcas]|uniref:Uncharacterized protein n=1 Tax=Jatropha curcas TaxID=180498 RepID=A0A067JYG0_JATCU|nr:hypothetical protein JCGZ_19508 [Jatropha curcas]
MYRWLEAKHLILTRPAVVHVEVVAQDAVPVDEEGRSLILLQENYTTARERIVTSQTDESEAESRIDEVVFYLEAVGGEKKRKVYGIGSQASQFYCGSAAHAFTASIAELRAHVMRLSGEAGTSSSDPAPATDRHVSKSQQQPLSAPDPDAADDTLVTPPGATSHPAGTPPGDPKSGDPTSNPADEQQRRFDFGPF